MMMADNSRAAALTPLPPFVSGREILADALPLLDPPSAISVTDAAERFMRIDVAGVWQAFDRNVTPYMVEPADMTQSRRFKSVVFVGPSQSGKSKMLEAVAMHAVTSDPGPVQIIHMSKTDADAWVEEKLDPTIENSPCIFDLIGKGRDDSTFSRKRFRGMRVTVGYPVARQLSSRTQRMVLCTDYDHFPVQLGGKDNPEGTPFRMARQRIKTFMSRGCVLAESTPAWPVTDPGWRPTEDAPHMMPPVAAGVVPLYNQGSRGRWYWECRDCVGLYEPRVDRLHYAKGLAPGAAGASAEMQCPHCGSLLAARHKAEMNRAALKGNGGWRHEAEDGSLVVIDDAALRATDIASYRLDGAAASFASWPEIVTNLESARVRAEADGDDTDLAMCNYTDIGWPHTPRALTEEGEITLEGLRKNLRGWPKKEAPAGTSFITVSVDVQKSRFPVQIIAWGERLECTVIDRFDLIAPPASSPNSEGRAIQPALYVEDWDALLDLGEKVWPVTGQNYGLKAAFLGVDYQGEAGVSDNAAAFWRARRKAGESGRWFVTRGEPGRKHAARVWYAAPERDAKGGKGRNVKILFIAVDRVKDSVAAALNRGEPGPNAMHLVDGMSEEHLAEFAAEHIGARGTWEKRPGQTRNECFDLSVQGRAMAEHKGAHRIDPANPPAWAEPGPGNIWAVSREDDAPEPVAAPETAAPIMINYLRR